MSTGREYWNADVIHNVTFCQTHFKMEYKQIPLAEGLFSLINCCKNDLMEQETLCNTELS